MSLHPFFLYFGAKWRAARLYPAPRHAILVEPFAGAAGYATRHPHKRVILVERDPLVAAAWRYLLGASDRDLAAIPILREFADLPDSAAPELRALLYVALDPDRNLPWTTVQQQAVGFATVQKRWRSIWRKQCPVIRHWKLIEGSYEDAPDVQATWYLDPPYERQDMSVKYAKAVRTIDYEALGAWMGRRRGQVIACESAAASWWGFRPLVVQKTNLWRRNGAHTEGIWIQEGDEPMTIFEQLVELATDGHAIDGRDPPCSHCGLVRWGPKGQSRKALFLFLAQACLEEMAASFDVFGAEYVGVTRVKIDEGTADGSGTVTLHGGPVGLELNWREGPFLRRVDRGVGQVKGMRWVDLRDPRAFARRVEEWLETTPGDDVAKITTAAE